MTDDLRAIHAHLRSLRLSLDESYAAIAALAELVDRMEQP